MNETKNACGSIAEYKTGPLPSCAPLAMAYTPMQRASEPEYDKDVALARGTLFPGLDLPFMNVVNKTPKETTPLTELMAIDFVLDELGLYLNTHKDDTEAFKAYKNFLKLAETGRTRYIELYGPLFKSDVGYSETYNWLKDPWPWNIAESEG